MNRGKLFKQMERFIVAQSGQRLSPVITILREGAFPRHTTDTPINAPDRWTA